MAKPERTVGVRAPSCCHKHHTRFEKRRFYKTVRRAVRQVLRRFTDQ